jgi:N-acetylmuramoyl-L-alanine amidase
MKRLFVFLFLWFQVLPSSAFPAEKGLTVKGIRYFSYETFTRIVFEIESAAPYVLTRTADSRQVVLASYEGRLTVKSPMPVIKDGVVNGIETREEAGRPVVAVRLDQPATDIKDFALRAPDRIVLDIMKGSQPVAGPSGGDRPVVVVVDAGHGGKDTGIVTVQGPEKAFTLTLAQDVKKILQKEARIKVVLTRDKDQALSLDERAAAANSAGAVVFVSIHAAAGAGERVFIQDPDQDPGSPAGRPVGRDFLGYETGSERQEKLWDRQQAAHARESGSLGRLLARRLAGEDSAEPVQAAIAGLKAVDAAAVLVEAGMEQNRMRTAEAIAKGIEQHVRENR